jgi:quercetin dioxygenase-like cupin family protein
VSVHLITPLPRDERAADPGDPLRLEPTPGLHLVELWACASLAADPFEVGAPSQFVPAPAVGGVRFRLVTLPHDPIGYMHRTATIDLVTVVRGEVSLALADGHETALRSGDTVVLRGTEHAWRNHTDTPAVLSVTLLGASVL